jgi:hypothetical protein
LATKHASNDDDGTNAAQDKQRVQSVSWNVRTDAPLHRHRKTALFYHDGTGWRLEHVREVTLRQRGQTTTDLAGDVSASDLPASVVRRADLSPNDDLDGGGGRS